MVKGASEKIDSLYNMQRIPRSCFKICLSLDFRDGSDDYIPFRCFSSEAKFSSFSDNRKSSFFG